MNILKMGTAIVSAVALFATPVVASAASNTKVSAAASKLGKRIGNRSNAALTDANKQSGTVVGVVAALVLIAGVWVLVDGNGNPVSG